MTSDPVKQAQGVQSVEIGSRLLAALAANGKSMMLRDLAKSVGMPASKAHRYLVSFVRMGLVEQDANTGRYALGHFALTLGLASLARIEPVSLATPILEDLCEEIGETVALAVWGTNGATCVRCIEATGPVTVTLRTGIVLPLTTTATGRVFAAFYQSPLLKKVLDAELGVAAKAGKTTQMALMREFEERLTEIRCRGIARASGGFAPGINGFSAPVFDHTGSMVAAIMSGGTIGHFNMEWDSSLALCVKEAATKLSIRLGYGYANAGELRN
ncbi:MAG: IclR family transcriptional regulator [Betaproteobacteria bacterium HGW-Betaproteobacteria-5]|nr:MAG: IclR family transcriptional regulator [Betaproteobacteria bacterium HGW-Betaproteobacteria-5]PKO41143.1 MAG: IclR family transcriptional regulator [Betaproteobacteria bacterium HGW-Betaproteobacteria-6]